MYRYRQSYLSSSLPLILLSLTAGEDLELEEGGDLEGGGHDFEEGGEVLEEVPEGGHDLEEGREDGPQEVWFVSLFRYTQYGL